MTDIKLIIFDLDGVLIDSKDWHYDSLNAALYKIDPKYVISYTEHLSKYDGLSTNKKLDILHKEKQLDPKYFSEIWDLKQQYTFDIIKQITHSTYLFNIFSQIKSAYPNIKITVASNSIRETVKLALLKLGILEFVDFYVSNQDVTYPKPYPEMYWKCMKEYRVLPSEALIIEDSPTGRQGALNSGANLLAIDKCSDLSFILIKNNIEKYKGNSMTIWKDEKLNVLIPMAGLGSRFSQAGYTFPKPLIDVNGKPMIQVVVENLNIDANYIFVVQEEHYTKYNLKHMLNLIAPNCKIVQVNGLTEGAACTALLAKEFIDNNNPLLIANSDQYIEWNSTETMYELSNSKIDGGMLVFTAVSSKWSFAELDSDGYIQRVAEKDPISNIASTGIYFYNKGSDFVKYAEQMISKDVRVNNEFYICPVYNQFIEDGKKLIVKYVDKMLGLGVPEDLEYFLRLYK